MTVAIKAPLPPKAPAPAPAPVKKATADVRYLELALSKVYNRGGQLFYAGKVYAFTPAQAVILLGEQDCGRAMWKPYRKPAPEPTKIQRIESNIVDATALEVKEVAADDILPTIEALEIGNDDEIADILAATANDADDVPV